MMPPIHRLKKHELTWLITHKCSHRHSYLDHYQCYLKEAPDREKIGFFDIETTNLAADFGIILCSCVLDAKTGKILSSVITEKQIKEAKAGDEDSLVVRQTIDNLMKFDRLIGFYSSRFDGPFIRTRAVACGLEFPCYDSLKHTDLYFLIRSKFRLSSNRLENACRVLLDKTQKTRIESRYWRAAGRGDARSLRYVLEHCKKDVQDLAKLYDKVVNFGAKRDTSI